MIEIIEKFTKIFKYIFSEIIEILKHNKSSQKKIITVKSAIKIENLNNHITLPVLDLQEEYVSKLPQEYILNAKQGQLVAQSLGEELGLGWGVTRNWKLAHNYPRSWLPLFLSGSYTHA